VAFEQVAKARKLFENGFGLKAGGRFGDNFTQGLGVSFGDGERHQSDLHATLARTPAAFRTQLRKCRNDVFR
jgi:hypothetical protein